MTFSDVRSGDVVYTLDTRYNTGYTNKAIVFRVDSSAFECQDDRGSIWVFSKNQGSTVEANRLCFWKPVQFGDQTPPERLVDVNLTVYVNYYPKTGVGTDHYLTREEAIANANPNAVATGVALTGRCSYMENR